MTKSGIGTQQQQPQQVSSAPSPANGQSGTSTTTTSASLIANAEIPIWVADKKKWVTGISKKTTINDLIFAILKQCQIVGASGGKPGEPTHAAQSDLITNQYVLVEYQFEPNTNSNSLDNVVGVINDQQVVITSQRILNGDSKVYKFLTKWSFTSGQQQQQPQQNNLMLKILQRQSYEGVTPLGQQTNSEQEGQQSNERPNSTSLATKLLKKFGVSSNTTAAVANSQLSKSSSLNNPSAASNTATPYRYVDVKLPTLSSSQSQPNHLGSNTITNKSFNLSPVSTNSTGSLNLQQQQLRSFDPNVQKSFLTNSIMEKDNKLKQQIKRFQLIDELIKETEKKSKSSATASTSALYEHSAEFSAVPVSTFVANPTYNYSSSSSPPGNTGLDSKALNVIDLNDIYCHFPEMCTHHLKEVCYNLYYIIINRDQNYVIDYLKNTKWD